MAANEVEVIAVTRPDQQSPIPRMKRSSLVEVTECHMLELTEKLSKTLSVQAGKHPDSGYRPDRPERNTL
jgi:hypothetical protein